MAGQLEIQLAADTAQYQAGITQAVTLTAQQMRKLADYVKAANDAQGQLGRGAQQAAAQAQTAYKTVSEGANQAAHANAGVTRELLVLTHEMSQGNMSRFGGSLLVLAERMELTSLKGLLLFGALAGIGGVLLGTIGLIAKGAMEADHFSKALQLTGNYAATSAAQVTELAAAQARLTGTTESAARESLQAVASSGLFSPELFSTIARAMTDYRKLSGATADEALKDFSRMKEGVARWASEQNQSMHFLTLAQYEHIKALEDAGQADAAAAEAASALSAALESRATPAVGTFAREWQRVKEWASAAAQAIENIGRPADKIAEQIARIDQQMQLVKQANLANPGDASDTLAALREQRAQLQQLQSRSTTDRAVQAEAEATQAAAIKAREYTDAVLKSAKAISARNQELAKYDAAVKAQAAAHSPMSPEDVKAGRDEIIKRFTPPNVQKQANEYANLIATVKAFTDTTTQETDGLAKLTDGQKFLVQVQEQLAKSGREISTQQRAHILDLARTAAATRDVADAEIRAQKATLARIQADTGNAQAQQAIVDSVLQGGNEQANVLLHKVALIGQTADEALKIQELQKFDDLIGKALLGADAGTVQRIQEIAKVLRGNLVQAIDGAKAAQDKWNASFEHGFSQAFQEYAKAAANSAQAGAQFFNDGIRDMNDALVGFFQTGKLGWRSLIDDAIANLIRLQEQKAFVSLFGAGGAGGAFDSVAGSAVATAIDFFPAFANGLDYVPYDGFPAVLHEGEKVLTKQDAATNRGGSGVVHIDASTRIGSVGAGVSRAEMHAVVAQTQAAGEARMRRLLRNGSVVTS
jgi:lambda family phage tail tape measure protein